jgi:hypothetical protein
MHVLDVERCVAGSCIRLAGATWWTVVPSLTPVRPMILVCGSIVSFRSGRPDRN